MTGELLIKILGALITIVIALVSAYVIPYVKTKMGETNFALLLGYIDIVNISLHFFLKDV